MALSTEPTNESIAEAKNLINVREANAMLCGVAKHIADATQGVEKHLAKRGMEKCQVFVPDFASTNFPFTFAEIRHVPRSDAALLKLLQSNDAYSLKIFRGGGKRCGLIVHNDKIVIPKTLQRRVVEWYHWYLCHPGETRTENTIRLTTGGTNLEIQYMTSVLSVIHVR